MNASQKTNEQTNELFKSRYRKECVRVNRFMTWLMAAQWLAGIGFATFYSPLTWIGQEYDIHVHVWAAILLGGAISSFAILWTRVYPHEWHTRHVIAICQMLWSALLIHLSGGRIETHFHVFASLAILSIYRDWKILITATVVVSADHFIRGVFYPLSAFGTVTESPFRWIEHTAWILFEVAFLAPGCNRLRNEIRELCVRQTEIEDAKATVDAKVAERTEEFVATNRQLEEKTREAEKLALVARYTHNAVVITDELGQIEWVNDGFERISGYSIAEVKGKVRGKILLGDKTNSQTVEYMLQQLEQKQGFDVEIINYAKSGHAFWLAIEMRPIHNQRGDVVKFIGIESDVTDKRKREENLRLLREAVDHANDAIFTIDRNSRFVDVNETACHRLRYDREELLSMSIPDIESNPKFKSWEDWWHAVKFQKVTLIEGSHKTRDGEIIPVEISPVFVNHEGSEYICAFARDVSERKRAEQERERLNNELQHAARRAGMAEVATGVLHNVGNVLNSVNVSASLIRERINASPVDHLTKASTVISDNKNNLRNFLNSDERGIHFPGFLNQLASNFRHEREAQLSEIKALVKNVEHIKEIVSMQQSFAKKSGTTEQVDPIELIENAVEINDSSLIRHGVEIIRGFEDVPAIETQRHDVLQILINLIGNAKQAFDNFEIDAKFIWLTAKSEDDCLVIEVKDNGVGVPKPNLNKIFQHGFTTKKSGHGFGLHMCANSAQELGGSLCAASDGEGKGTTFTLKLPISTETAVCHS